MFDLDNVMYPGSILNKVVAFDPAAWDEITAHADRLFKEQRKLRYLETDKVCLPNLFSRLKNLAVRSYNEAVKCQKEAYLRPVVSAYASVSGRCGGGLQFMTPNMEAGLLTYVEQNKERLIEGAGITLQDILDLRLFVSPTWKPDAFAPEKNI
ncbi:MAG TPA: hypothetical protein VFS88_04425 [Micavibrio sp.]|nr:hypothetical protein [Micavibrio sp.]